MVATIHKTQPAPPAPPKGGPNAASDKEAAKQRPVLPVSPSSLLALAPPPTMPHGEGPHADLPIPGLAPRPHLVTPDHAPEAQPPAPTPSPPEEAHHGLTLGQKCTLIGAMGVAVFGGIIGYTYGRASATPQPQVSQSAPALLDGEGNPAPELHRPVRPGPSAVVNGAGTAVATSAAAGAVATSRKPEQPVQDPPAEEINAPTLLDGDGAPAPVERAVVAARAARGNRPQGQTEWRTYNGTLRGETFSFQYPAGWRVTKLMNGFMVTHPQNEKLGAGFYWANGAGEASPEGMLQMLANDSGASDWHTLSNTPDAPNQSPIGPVYGTTTEATYTLRGTPSRGRFHSTVTVNRSGYASLWYASVTSTSAPAEQWSEYGPVLQRIVQSFNADVNQGGEG